MIDLTGVQHHHAITEIVDVICKKTQTVDRSFFNATVAYFLGKMAANQRATIKTKDRGDIPVNLYTLALAPSGFGKGHSVSIIENEFMKGFQKRFMEDTFPQIADQHLWEIANDRAAKNASDPEEERKKLDSEFRSSGAFPFTFDSGTTPAVKQLRSKLLLANCGSINLQIDEIGLNLVNAVEVLTTFLELYDQGRVKLKLIKNTAENVRNEEVDGKTPSNMLLFGTPSKLFDGGQTEDHFYSMLDTGYARRCIFGYGHLDKRAHDQGLTAAQIFANLIDTSNQATISKWSQHFYYLADPDGYDWQMDVDDAVSIRLLEYKIACERAAHQLPEHEDIKKAELNHRYFKALKLAGAYAFVDASTQVEMEHLMSAILLVEESGKSFETILSREKPYVKLAKYIADVGKEVTHPDLTEDLPFYPRSNGARQDMMNMAIAWGYKRHIVIKKTFSDSIEFFRGEKLKETDLDEIIVSYAPHYAFGYQGERAPFHELVNLVQAEHETKPGEPMHWANHWFKKQHRAEENVVAGFNLITLDVDEGINLEAAIELLKDYKLLAYTTKRHQQPGYGDRFRLLLPTNYELALDSEEYRTFMNAIMDWLPFKVDEASNQRSKKWESYAFGQAVYNDGELFDVLPFIPKTSRNEEFLKERRELQSLDSLERWFAGRMGPGNRNNQMIKYALMLVDNGWPLVDVQNAVHSFNDKLGDPMSKQEIDSTVLVTVAKRYHP